MDFLVKLHDKINKKLGNDKFVYSLNFFMLIFSLVFTAVFYYADNGNNNAFIRSGVALIISGVIIEYTLSSIKIYEYSDTVKIEGISIVKEKELPKVYKNQKMLAHFSILIGTLIWGFADLLPQSFYLFR